MNPPFKMTPSRRAAVKRDGKHLVSGRASFCWETILQSRVAGVPGNYEIRRDEKGAPWHTVEISMEQAEELLQVWGMFGPQRVRQMRIMRKGRKRRNLPVG